MPRYPTPNTCQSLHHPRVLAVLTRPAFDCVLQEIRNMHNEQLMGIRREEEMEMSDDDMEDTPDSKDSEDSGMHMHARIHSSTLLSA